jgi:hypothetical protein
MIKEIMPLSKNFPAVGDVTWKNIWSTARHRIIELNLTHFPSVRDVYFAFKDACIYGFTSKIFEDTSLREPKLLANSCLQCLSRESSWGYPIRHFYSCQQLELIKGLVAFLLFSVRFIFIFELTILMFDF